MNRMLIISLLLALVVFSPLYGQKYPERRPIRQGNAHYEAENYPESEVDYRRALEKSPASHAAAWNLGKALYKQQRWDEAAQAIAPPAADSAHVTTSAAAYYDLGGALFQQRKLKEALEAYKQSLRLNPDDREAKFNLAYVQKLLENEENTGGGGGGEQPEPQPQPQNQPEPDEGADEQQPQGGMTRQEAEQLLEAMQAREDQHRPQNGERRQAIGATNGKNW